MSARAIVILLVIAAFLVPVAGTVAAAGGAHAQLSFTIDIVPGKNHIQLTWTPDTAYCSYEVHRSPTPYLVPGSTTLQATLAAGSSSYVDYGAAHNPSLNYTYLVRGMACGGDAVDSGQKGEFDFGLTGSDSAPDIAYQAYGFNFSPYIAAGEDPAKGDGQITDEELADRMGVIAPYAGWVRTFGCNNDLQEAGKFAHTMGKKAAIGAWLGPETNDQEKKANRDQLDCLKARIAAHEVDMAIVGSEVLLRNDLTESQLVAYIDEIRQFALDQGQSIEVTTADVYSELLAHPSAVAYSFPVLANYYPYWEGKGLDDAVAYVDLWHHQLKATYPWKEVMVSESGWPSCGDRFGDAVPSPENASTYFLNLVSWARAKSVRYFYFEALDEGWKAAHEGPQGACWGVWTASGALKPGMERVFHGETMPDNWTNPPTAPIIDFFTLPDRTDTNLSTFVVAGHTDPANDVLLNGTPLPASSRDGAGNFAYAPSLVTGDNVLRLEIAAAGEPVQSTEKVVHVDPAWSSANRRLLYVYSVSWGTAVPALPGTIVIDVDHNTLLGLIPGKYAAGIAPDGRELYMSDKTVYSTATHTQLRTLPFFASIGINNSVASPDGTRLYVGNQRLDLASNTLLADLPAYIATGSMGPDISRDGRHIYCCNYMRVIDTESNTSVVSPIWSEIPSDFAITPPEDRLLISEYSYAKGRLRIYDAATFALLGTVDALGDYTGDIALAKDGRRVVVGSAGNPAWTNDGKVSVIDIDAQKLLSQLTIPLADNVATSGADEFFVSTGENNLYRRQGVDVFVLDGTDHLVRLKTFFLGINRWVLGSSSPTYDQIAKILFKP